MRKRKERLPMTKEDWDGMIVIVVLCAFVLAIVTTAYFAGIDKGKAQCLDMIEAAE